MKNKKNRKTTPKKTGKKTLVTDKVNNITYYIGDYWRDLTQQALKVFPEQGVTSAKESAVECYALRDIEFAKASIQFLYETESEHKDDMAQFLSLIVDFVTALSLDNGEYENAYKIYTFKDEFLLSKGYDVHYQ